MPGLRPSCSARWAISKWARRGGLAPTGEGGLKKLLGTALKELKRPDIMVGNLEGPVSSRGRGNPRKRFQFRFPPDSCGALKSAGFDLLLFANNHIFDFGEEAFTDSLLDAKKAGLPLVGAGMTLDEALQGASVSAPGLGEKNQIRFIGFADYRMRPEGLPRRKGGRGRKRRDIIPVKRELSPLYEQPRSRAPRSSSSAMAAPSIRLGPCPRFAGGTGPSSMPARWPLSPPIPMSFKAPRSTKMAL